MNAAPILPAKAEIPAAPKNEGHRGNSPRQSVQEDARSFMSTLRKVSDEAPAKASEANRVIAENAAGDWEESGLNPADEESLTAGAILIETDQQLPMAGAAPPLEEGLNQETGTVIEKPILAFEDNNPPVAGDDLANVPADDDVPVDTAAKVASVEEKLSPDDTFAAMAKPKTVATTVTDVSPVSKHGAPVQDRSETGSHEMQVPPKLVRPATPGKIMPSDAAPDGGDDHPEALDMRLRQQTAAPNAANSSTARPADWSSPQATSATPSEIPILSNAIGRQNEKNDAMTIKRALEPKVMVEATAEEQTQPTKGPVEAKVALVSESVEKPVASNRFAPPTASDAPGRPDWLPPVERVDQTPFNRSSPSMTIAKEDGSLSTASFRENNMAQIVERVAVSVRGGQSEARIVLKPDHLGSLRVQITTENNTVSIRIMTEFSMARDLLEHHLPQLKMELQQQGLEVEKFDVSLSEDQQNLSRHGRRQPNTSAARPKTGSRNENADEQTDEGPADRAEGQQPKTAGVDFFA